MLESLDTRRLLSGTDPSTIDIAVLVVNTDSGSGSYLDLGPAPSSGALGADPSASQGQPPISTLLYVVEESGSGTGGSSGTIVQTGLFGVNEQPNGPVLPPPTSTIPIGDGSQVVDSGTGPGQVLPMPGGSITFSPILGGFSGTNDLGGGSSISIDLFGGARGNGGQAAGGQGQAGDGGDDGDGTNRNNNVPILPDPPNFTFTLDFGPFGPGDQSGSAPSDGNPPAGGTAPASGTAPGAGGPLGGMTLSQWAALEQLLAASGQSQGGVPPSAYPPVDGGLPSGGPSTSGGGDGSGVLGTLGGGSGGGTSPILGGDPTQGSGLGSLPPTVDPGPITVPSPGDGFFPSGGDFPGSDSGDPSLSGGGTITPSTTIVIPTPGSGQLMTFPIGLGNFLWNIIHRSYAVVDLCP